MPDKEGSGDMCTKENCPYKDVIEDHESRIRDAEDLKSVIVGIQKDVGYILKVLDPLVKAVEELRNKPAKRWEVLIGVLIGGGGTYLLSQILS